MKTIKDIFEKTKVVDECLIWTGDTSKARPNSKQVYPQIWFEKKQWRGNRLVWTLANGRAIKPKHSINHICDNGLCINPAHLYEGTIKDNNRDTYSRNRHPRPKVSLEARLNEIGKFKFPGQFSTKKREGKKYKGIYKQADRWCARIRVMGSDTHLGTFKSEVEAAKAYDLAAIQVHGDKAVLNFPNGDL